MNWLREHRGSVGFFVGSILGIIAVFFSFFLLTLKTEGSVVISILKHPRPEIRTEASALIDVVAAAINRAGDINDLEGLRKIKEALEQAVDYRWGWMHPPQEDLPPGKIET